MKAYECHYEGETEEYYSLFWADSPEKAVLNALSNPNFAENDDLECSDDIDVKRAHWADDLDDAPFKETISELQNHGYDYYLWKIWGQYR